jgi:hypothetical protein
MSTVDRLAVGDRVRVDDEGLHRLRELMRSFGRAVPPNHHGTISEVWEDSYLIDFDDGGAAPYPFSDVHPLIAVVVDGTATEGPP